LIVILQKSGSELKNLKDMIESKT